MPRTAAGKKNQHNPRHENGLVGPGKRISKQRSNGQINGAAKGPIPDTPPLTPTTSDPLMRNRVANESDPSLSDSKQDLVSSLGPHGLPKRSSISSHDGHSEHPSAKEGGDWNASRTNDTNSARQASHAEVGTLQLASTILKSCPAYDTVAMLILLLQLPPIFLTLVQALFASLTFMPPSGASMTSLFTLFDVFQGSAGTPSLGTMVAVDTLCLAGWFCLWNWARNFALDLAQVQIAITLGGGNSGKAGSVNSLCVAIVLLLHLVRSRSVRQFLFAYVIKSRLLAGEQVAQIVKFLPHDFELGTTPQAPSWSRSLFAIHIITQAGIAIIRRNVARGQASTSSKSSKKADPDIVVAGHGPADSAHLELAATSAGPAMGDGLSPTTLGFKDGRERAISAKKRKKQASQVRSRQPFWAAVASTKVNALREIEVSRPAATPSGPFLDGSLDPASLEEDQIRITHVDCATIKFEALNLPSDLDTEDDSPTNQKPLFVRINGAYWTSTAIYPSDLDDPSETWIGEITGLIPNCTYTCSFVHPNGDEIAAIMVKTPILVDGDPASLSSPLFRSSQRPSSPTTTIRQSIATAEAKHTDIKTRANKSRRSHKAALSKLEREVESFNGRLKASSDDTKQRQKLLQAERTMKQNEDATQSISAALVDLSTIPEETDDYATKKDAYDKQCELLANANESLASAKTSADSELANFQEELKATHRQRERHLTRQARLIEQHDRITHANLQGLNEKERKAAETMAKERDHARIEADYSNQFNILHRELSNYSARTQQAKQESQAYEAQMMQQQQHQHSSVMDGQFSGNNITSGRVASQTPPSSFNHGVPSSNYTYATPPGPISPESNYASPLLPQSRPTPFYSDPHDPPPTFDSTRARSASNRSGGAYSNYSAGAADFDDADPIPPMPGLSKFSSADMHTRRKGSGGSSGANSASPVNGAGAGAGAGAGMVSPYRPVSNGRASAGGTRRESPGMGKW